MNNQPQNPAMISLDNVSKTYKIGGKKVSALTNISLEVKKGEFVAIIGASGCGKSTLLHMIGGLDRPSEGEVIIDSKRLGKISDRALSKFRNQTIGCVFQFFYLQPFLTVARNLEIATMPNRMKRADCKLRIAELLDQVGLSDRAKHRSRELSGGQIQRVAIARALVNRPEIILADEPTGNLDSKNSQEIIELLKEIRNRQGATIVLATHDMSLASQADRIIRLRDGQVVND